MTNDPEVAAAIAYAIAKDRDKADPKLREQLRHLIRPLDRCEYIAFLDELQRLRAKEIRH